MTQALKFAQIAEKISSVPTLPSVVEKLGKLLSNPQTTADQISRVITTDQAITTKVLKLVNSAFYGFPGRIGTVTHAITILGFSIVKNVVLTASIFDFFKQGNSANPDFNLDKFWLHSIACGAASQVIAQEIGFRDKEECFIAGLVHDIGKIILCQYMPDEFSRIIANARRENISFYDSEKKLFDLSHQEIGGMLIQRWKLPAHHQEVVAHHHSPLPSQKYYAMSGIVHAADVLIRALGHGNGGDNLVPALSEDVWKTTKLSEINLDKLLDKIDEEVEKASGLLAIL